MSSLSDLWASPHQLWVVLGMKFLEGVAFFSLMYILVKYLSDELGFSDVESGWLFAFCNGMQFPFALCLSFVLDSWGVKRMSIIGQSLLVAARLALWQSHSRWLICLVLTIVYPMGTAALFPALVVAVKRFTTPQSRPYAFGIFYICLNLGSLCVAGVLNYSRHHFESSEMYSRILFLGFISCSIGFLGSFFLTEWEESDTPRAESASPASATQTLPSPRVSQREGTLEVLRSSTFLRFIAVISSFIMIRLLFGHLKATVPKWMTREFGEETPYELYIGINPALIIVLVPICTRVCEMLKLRTEVSLIVGAFISGFSPFILALVVPSTIAAASFIVVFSIGEAIWSPKLYEYTVAVPQEGREGVFVAVGSAPLYLAKFLAGATSGYLLKYYCPRSDTAGSDEDGCQTRALWLAIACTTSVTPVLLLCFQQQLFGKHQEDADESSALLKKGTA